MTEAIMIGVSIAMIGGLITAVAKHITNDERHPKKDDIVYRDVCEAAHKGLNDTINARFDNVNEKIRNLDTTMQREFTEVKDLIRNGHAN